LIHLGHLLRVRLTRLPCHNDHIEFVHIGSPAGLFACAPAFAA
jgi:hypothetical protein